MKAASVLVGHAGVAFPQDRAGHDRRYAIDASRIETELGFTPAERFESGIEKTLDWYFAKVSWWQALIS